MSPRVLAVVWVGASVLAGHVVGGVLVLTDDVLARTTATAVPANVNLVATVFRHRPTNKSPVPAERLTSCRTLAELAQVLRAAGPVEVLCHARREIACAPTARAEFLATETRPSFLLHDNGGTPTNQVFGLELHADVRELFPATATAAPVFTVTWEGSWSCSVSLLARWETIAVRGFNLARNVPGITYTKVEEDEDGFVNTGGGTDFGGFFRRKKKDKAADKKKPLAAIASAAKSPSAEHEPSYSAETAVEKIPLHGDWLGAGGQLLITHVPLTVGDNPGELYFVLQPGAAD